MSVSLAHTMLLLFAKSDDRNKTVRTLNTSSEYNGCSTENKELEKFSIYLFFFWRKIEKSVHTFRSFQKKQQNYFYCDFYEKKTIYLNNNKFLSKYFDDFLEKHWTEHPLIWYDKIDNVEVLFDVVFAKYLNCIKSSAKNIHSLL